MRKRLWQIHSWLGLICGLALLVIGLTGSLLVFHQEISDALYPETTLNAGFTPGKERLLLSELTQALDRKFPDYWIRGWMIRYDSKLRDKAYLMDRGGDDWHILYVDPYTGDSAVRPLGYNETLYGWFIQLHYTFFIDHIGMTLTAVFALAFMILGVSGLYIHRPFFKALFRLRWRGSARIFFSDLHKAVGIATIPFNLIFGFTGAYWNITHVAHELIEHAGEDRLDKLSPIAQQEIPGYSLNYIYFPTEKDPTYYLYGRSPGTNPLRSLYGSNLWVDAASGEVTERSDLREQSLWAKIVDAFEPLHFGDFGGLTTKVLWCLAGFSPALLSLSGTLIYFKRKRRKTTG